MLGAWVFRWPNHSEVVVSVAPPPPQKRSRRARWCQAGLPLFKKGSEPVPSASKDYQPRHPSHVCHFRDAFIVCNRATCAIAGLALAAACVPIEPASSDGDAPGVVRHRATVSDSNALIAEVRVSLNSPARVFVEYDNPQAGRYRTRVAALATEHVIPVVRLRPETTYDYTIFTVYGADESDAVRGPSGSFTTGELPDLLASVFTMATGRSSQPLILSDYEKLKRDDSDYFVFWDEVGALVWYLRVVGRSAVARRPGSEDFIFAHRRGPMQFTPLGKVSRLGVGGGDVGIWHHDVLPLDSDRVLFPMARVVHVGNGDQRRKVRYDSVAIWHSATGRVEEVWNARKTWDILDPAQYWAPMWDWTHLNSVSPRWGSKLLLSLRNRSQVVSLTPDYEIEWQLHGPDSDYEFPDPTDRFYHQHTASQLANGNILLFDNGSGRPDAEGGEYSRALELRLDDAAGTAVKAWEYRHVPDIYGPTMSSAYRLDSGNTLVNFGTRDAEHRAAPLVVVEVAPTGDEVFRIETVQLHGSPSRYRAYGGIDAIYGETMLRPPTALVQRPPPVRRHYERMEHVAASTFDLYLEDGHLVYAKAPCAMEDIALPFFLHVSPKKSFLLAEDRRDVGFDNLDFKFFQRGLRWDGRCHAEVPLPEYEIDHIVTGQFVADEEATDGRVRSNDAPASGEWIVEIPLAR